MAKNKTEKKAKSTKPKTTKQKTTKPKPVKSEPQPVDTYIKRLENTDVYINVKNHAINLIPIKTHIGYVYRHSNGELMPVISAFVQSHYIDASGLPGMMIKCGNRTYANLYETIEKIYIYKRDQVKVLEEMKRNATMQKSKLSEEEMAARIKKLEEKLSEFAIKLTRSTSTVQLVDTKQSKPRRVASIVHEPKKRRETPVKF